MLRVAWRCDRRPLTATTVDGGKVVAVLTDKRWGPTHWVYSASPHNATLLSRAPSLPDPSFAPELFTVQRALALTASRWVRVKPVRG